MNCEYSVLIVGVAVVVIPSADDSKHYKDLINSMLLAQLAANKKIEKTPSVNWYDVYVGFLDNYWLRHSRARQDLFIAHDNIESVADWTVAALFKGTAADKSAAALVLRRLTLLSGTEPALVLLRQHVQKVSPPEPDETLASARAVRLLVAVANSPTSVTSVYLELETDRILGCNPLAELFQAGEVRGSVCMRYAAASLSETLYAPVREAIALKIRDRLDDNVAMLTLPDEERVADN
ncbi:hypothetical protein [Pseudomonas sp. H1h]|uniref:hypothetical protein n=1 Tax=Pseudomonas sp. H1h TaxID=1397280 RepID=UPI000469F7BD|nr:hypothetical protein [Pseudomonas sp. H1h]